jgi:hypothetical protein
MKWKLRIKKPRVIIVDFSSKITKTHTNKILDHDDDFMKFSPRRHYRIVSWYKKDNSIWQFGQTRLNISAQRPCWSTKQFQFEFTPKQGSQTRIQR